MQTNTHNKAQVGNHLVGSNIIPSPHKPKDLVTFITDLQRKLRNHNDDGTAELCLQITIFKSPLINEEDLLFSEALCEWGNSSASSGNTTDKAIKLLIKLCQKCGHKQRDFLEEVHRKLGEFLTNGEMRKVIH